MQTILQDLQVSSKYCASKIGNNMLAASMQDLVKCKERAMKMVLSLHISCKSLQVSCKIESNIYLARFMPAR